MLTSIHATRHSQTTINMFEPDIEVEVLLTQYWTNVRKGGIYANPANPASPEEESGECFGSSNKRLGC
jgi:hypothetical protein